MKGTLLTGAVLIFLVGNARSLTLSDEQKIDEFIYEILECSGIPGLTLAGVQDGEIVLTKGYGLANVEQGIEVDPDTKFCIRSLSKGFTTALLAILLNEHASYDWDTPVRDVMGDWFYLYNGYYANQTTIRDIVSMRTGYISQINVMEVDVFSKEEFLRRMRFFTPAIPFRYGYIYNNMMLALAGFVAEEIGGDINWFDLVKERLLDPIGMTSTVLIDSAPPDYEGFATPYFRQSLDDPLSVVPVEYYVGIRTGGPAGFIASTSNDMAKWLEFWLNDATTQDGDQLLSPQEQAEFFTPETSIPATPPPAESPVLYIPFDKYAKGWANGYYRDSPLIAHSGGGTDYISLLHLLQKKGVGTYVSVNHPDRDLVYPILAYVDDILLGEEPWLSAAEVCALLPGKNKLPSPDTYIPQTNLAKTLWTYTSLEHIEDSKFKKETRQKILQKSSITRPTRQIEDYQGTYGNFGYGNVTIILNGEALEMLYGSIGHFRLVSVGEDIFDLEGVTNVANFLFYGPVVFESSQGDDVIDLLTITNFDDWPTFVQDLDLADAPPPDLESCQ